MIFEYSLNLNILPFIRIIKREFLSKIQLHDKFSKIQ